MTMQAAATTDLHHLDPFVGVWNTEGEIRGDPSQPASRFRAADIYEWLAGGYFLLHRFEAAMPDGKVKGIEIIGHNKEDDCYPMHSFDNFGNAGVMQARIRDGIWTFAGESMRFSGGFRNNGLIFAGSWELRSDDGSDWRPWMDVTLMKAE
jgi:hypothetical protein